MTRHVRGRSSTLVPGSWYPIMLRKFRTPDGISSPIIRASIKVLNQRTGILNVGKCHASHHHRRQIHKNIKSHLHVKVMAFYANMLAPSITLPLLSNTVPYLLFARSREPVEVEPSGTYGVPGGACFFLYLFS